MIVTRFDRASDESLVDRITRYNNTQNPINPWELRVPDAIQQRIGQDLGALGLVYQLRRGRIKRAAGDIHYEKLGPWLSAFYGDPTSAHRNKAELFESERRYRQLFSEQSDVRNLLAVYRLGQATGEVKAQLRQKLDADTATGDEERQYRYFRLGPFAFVLMHVCAEALCVILPGTSGDYKYRVVLKADLLTDAPRAINAFSRLIRMAMGPVHQYLQARDAYAEIKTTAGIEQLASHVKTIFGMVNEGQPNTFAEIRGGFEVLP